MSNERMSEFPALTISLACSPLRMRVRECANQCRKLYSSWVLCKKLKYSHAGPGLASGFAKIPRVFCTCRHTDSQHPKCPNSSIGGEVRVIHTHTHKGCNSTTHPHPPNCRVFTERLEAFRKTYYIASRRTYKC